MKFIASLFVGAVAPVFFAVLFGLSFWYFSIQIDVRLLEGVQNPKILDPFERWGGYAGFLLGFLSLILGYLFFLILKIFKGGEYFWARYMVSFVMILPWYFVARHLLYFEPQYTEFGRSVIFFIGEPLLTTVAFLFWLYLLIAFGILLKDLLTKYIFKTANALVLALFPSLFLFSGCIGDAESLLCAVFEDGDHCYQNAAVQEGDAAGCEKVSGEAFSESGSNPPKDKCYLQIAENTGDLSVCNNIKGGLFSYTKEECILSTSIKSGNASGCKQLSGEDFEACKTAVSPKIESYKILEVDAQIKTLEETLKNSPDPELEKQLAGLKTMKNDMLEIASDKTKAEYEEISDPMYQQIAGDYAVGALDKNSKDSLLALSKSLKAKGESLSSEDYEALKNYLAFKNDPKNNIENMDAKEILSKRWNEKIGDAVESLKFWKSNPTAAESKYDEQLWFYERMLERQAAILKGQSEYEQDIDRNFGIVAGGAGDAVQDKVQGEVIKYIFGEATEKTTGAMTAIVGEALDTVKSEAKSMEFRGLVRAYNLGMEEELKKAGGNVEKAHAAVVKNMEADPYRYEDSHSFAQYGNILENKDCDGSNPHCINRDVFWKSMKKSYAFQQEKGEKK